MFGTARAFACSALCLAGCAPFDDPRDEPALIAMALAPTARADPTNAFADDPDAAAFGQTLFFDPSFSGVLLDGDNDGTEHATGRRGESGRVSCASCHVAEDGFSDTRTLGEQISLGAGWGFRRAISLLDVSESASLMWDGRRDSLFSQVFGPMESEVEMNGSRLFTAKQVFANHRAAYEAIFGPMPPLDDATRFPHLTPETTGCSILQEQERRCASNVHGIPGDGAEYDSMSPEDQDAVTRVVANVGKAMGAYERLLRCGPGAFDAWMAGDDEAMSSEAIEGARLFVGRAGCVNCHRGPTLSDDQFHNIGLRPVVVAVVFIDLDDRGAAEGLAMLEASGLSSESAYSDGAREPISRGPELEGAFRTPRLRCVSGRPTFMHTGQLLSLEEVIRFHVRGGDAGGYPGVNELEPLDLDPSEQDALLAFLNALDGPGPAAALLAAP